MFKLMKNLTKKDFLVMIISTILIVLQVWLDLKLPDYMSNITILVQTNGAIKDIIKEGAYMLSCAFGSLISSFIVGYLIANLSARFSKNIRLKIFDKVQSFSMEEMKKFQTSSLITRTTNDVTNIEILISMGLQLLIKAPITAAWAIVKILNKNITWSMLTLIAVLVLLVTIVILILTVLPKFKIVQKLIDNINNLVRENLIGIRVIRAFNAEDYQDDRFEKGNNDLTKTQMFNQRMMSIVSPIMYLVMNILTLGIYFVGAYIIDKAMMIDKIATFSDMVVFSSYAMQVIMSFLMLAMIFIMYPRASVSAGRINEILSEDEKIRDGHIAKENDLKGEIEFNNVSFKYPDSSEYVLENISFKAHAGDTIAFIGSTGSGKSTLINLIPRFYDVTEGEILIDGIDVRDYKLKTLYKKMGYVPQKAVIFNGTIKSNVLYGDIKKDDMDNFNKAIEIAQAKDFIDKLPKKGDNEIARNGTNVSGGQKQRISIARAVARRPEFYIFDDSFSALDYKTDYLLRNNLKKYTKDATKLIVAQRIGTIMNATKIIVLDKGKCVGMGTHKELLENCQVYKEIAYSQLSKEELSNE